MAINLITQAENKLFSIGHSECPKNTSFNKICSFKIIRISDSQQKKKNKERRRETRTIRIIELEFFTINL